ncbi:MAG: hypothetical protein M1823_002001 [Watsoniomyces obsoletus]|nr:MAG: hypothetical protein M1823_002001 [Watsoniomyces obsoletus]
MRTSTLLHLHSLTSPLIRSLHTTPTFLLPLNRRRKTFNRNQDTDEPQRGQFPRQRGGGNRAAPPSTTPTFLPEEDPTITTEGDSTKVNIHPPTSPEVQRLQELLPHEPIGFEEGLTDEELEYLNSKAEREHGVPVDYNPIGLAIPTSTSSDPPITTTEVSTFSDLSDLRPEIARSKEGLLETLESGIRTLAKRRVDVYIHESDLAFRLLKGRKILFESEDEMERVLREAKDMLEKREYWRCWRLLKKEHLKNGGGNVRSGGRGGKKQGDGGKNMVYETLKKKRVIEDLQIEPVDNDLKEKLLGKLVEGRYWTKLGGSSGDLGSGNAGGREVGGKKSEKDGGGKKEEENTWVLKEIQRMTAINGTYDVRDQKLLMEKIRGVLSFSSPGVSPSVTAAPGAGAGVGGGKGRQGGGVGNVRGSGGNQNQKRGVARTVRT